MKLNQTARGCGLVYFIAASVVIRRTSGILQLLDATTSSEIESQKTNLEEARKSFESRDIIKLAERMP